MNAETHHLFNINAAFLVLTIAVVALRFATRYKQVLRNKRPWSRQSLIVSDVFMILALVLYIAVAAIVFDALHNPFASIEIPALVRDEAVLNRVIQELTVVSLLYPIVICAGKLSILFFYREIFNLRRFRIINTCIMVALVGWTIAFVVATLLRCLPPSAIWIFEQQTLPTTHCFPLGTLILAEELTNIFFDLVILIAPLDQLRRLQMPVSKKLGVGCLFGLGAFVTVISIIRITLFYKSQLPPFTSAFIWTILLLSLMIIGINIPTLLPLVPKAFAARVENWSQRLLLFSRNSFSGRARGAAKQSDEAQHQPPTKPASSRQKDPANGSEYADSYAMTSIAPSTKPDDTYIGVRREVEVTATTMV